MLRGFRGRYQLALLILLSAGFTRVVPAFHHHEEEHACARLDGQFVYITAAEAAVSNQGEPGLRGMRLGEHHSHHECSLCKLHLQTLCAASVSQDAWFSAYDGIAAFSLLRTERFPVAPPGRGPPHATA